MAGRGPPGDEDAGPAEGTLAALDLAHALRTPLTSLALGLGLLDDGVLGALNEAQRDVVHTLVTEVARLTLLVERRLDTGRLGSYAGPVERVKVDLAALVRRAAEPIERQAGDRGVRLAFSLEGGVVVVGDPVKLAWVAVSLMGNALRYSPHEGAIEVALALVAGEAALSVGDAGPGFEPEAVARIFERGGGPTLFLVREILEAHGGRIALRSAPGMGSTFTISLPAVPGDEGV